MTRKAISSILAGMEPLSLVVITRNAEHHIARCIRSVPFATDILVLDSGSTDQTVTVAKNLGARVVVEEWRGFGPQKRRATDLVKTDWVLNLDADEALSVDAQREVQQLMKGGHLAHTAFAFPRVSFHLGRWIWHGGWYPDWQIRLYDRRQANWSADQLHEKVQSTSVGYLVKPVEHFVFKDLSDQVATNNRYSTLGCEKLIKQGRKFWLLNLLLKPKIKFLELYIWKRGFLDGLPGFIIAVGAAYSVFLKWAKLWESEKAGK